MDYRPFLLTGTQTAELDRAADLHQLPTLWAIPDLVPCHRLTCFLAPSGTGLSTLALRLLAHVAPAPDFVPSGAAWQAASPTPLPTESPSPTRDPAPCYGIINNAVCGFSGLAQKKVSA